jgi:hypothetical protein
VFGEYEHSLSKNMGASDGSQIQNSKLLENGFDYISVIGGDLLSK